MKQVHNLTSGHTVDVLFDDEGSFQKCYVSSRCLELGDVEELYRIVTDAELYGVNSEEMSDD